MDGILSERENAAQKDYTCTCCRATIWKGQTYTRAYWKSEWSGYRAKPIDAKFCTRCHTPPMRLIETCNPLDDGYAYIRERYRVPVRVGQCIWVAGVTGTVAKAEHHQHYVHFIRDGAKRPEVAHPTWETVYFDKDGKVLADYRADKSKPLEGVA